MFYVQLPGSSYSCVFAQTCPVQLPVARWGPILSGSGGNICAQFPQGGGCCAAQSQRAAERLHPSTGAAEFHTGGKHHTLLGLHLGMDSLPGGHLPGSPGTATLGHPWPVSTLSQQSGGRAMPWAQPWMGKASCAGPQVTNCCLQVFLLPVEMCLQDFWRWICGCVFIA